MKEPASAGFFLPLPFVLALAAVRRAERAVDGRLAMPVFERRFELCDNLGNIFPWHAARQAISWFQEVTLFTR